MIDGWTPGIGDPDAMGWTVVGAYLVAGWLCLGAAAATGPSQERRGAARPARRFWSLLAAAMLILAINTQLDLQSLLTIVGRRIAQQQGWYGDRRPVQLAFIVGLALGGILLLGVVIGHLRHHGRWLWLAGAGLTFLVLFILVRAASFHHIDSLLYASGVGATAAHLVELAAIVAIGAGAAGARFRR